jgi:hypothetical protein
MQLILLDEGGQGEGGDEEGGGDEEEGGEEEEEEEEEPEDPKPALVERIPLSPVISASEIGLIGGY